MVVVVIEQHNEDGVEWVVSFDGSNPVKDLSFVAASSEDAFKAKELIEAALNGALPPRCYLPIRE
jgi:hypothetical protein